MLLYLKLYLVRYEFLRFTCINRSASIKARLVFGARTIQVAIDFADGALVLILLELLLQAVGRLALGLRLPMRQRVLVGYLHVVDVDWNHLWDCWKPRVLQVGLTRHRLESAVVVVVYYVDASLQRVDDSLRNLDDALRLAWRIVVKSRGRCLIFCWLFFRIWASVLQVLRCLGRESTVFLGILLIDRSIDPHSDLAEFG